MHTLGAWTSVQDTPQPSASAHLQALKRKAEERNPDEFYFGMQKKKTKDGVHDGKLTVQNKYSQDELRLMKTQVRWVDGMDRGVERIGPRCTMDWIRLAQNAWASWDKLWLMRWHWKGVRTNVD